MLYRVKVRKKARKSLSKIPRPFRHRIIAALLKLGNNPYLGEPLQGEFRGKYSLHIHPYRIIYEVYKKEMIVFVIRICHRGRAYKKQS